jgi:hypothetical protein
MSSIYGGNGGMELFEAFLEDFVDCSGFLDYFKALWFPRLGWSICPLLHHFLLALSSFFLLDVFDEFFIQLFNMSATAQCLPGAWTTVLKTTPLASAEVASAIESYHHVLKLRLLNEADESIYQRADWLVHMLGTKFILTTGWMNFLGRKVSLVIGGVNGKMAQINGSRDCKFQILILKIIVLEWSARKLRRGPMP